MNVIWIILAALSFIGGQACLVYLLRRLDKHLERRSNDEPKFPDDDSCRYPEEDVVE